MSRNLFSFFSGKSEAPAEADVQMVSASAEELLETCKQLGTEVKKVTDDKLYIENRLREDIEMHRSFNAELKTRLTAREGEIAQLKQEVEQAKGSAAEEARTLIARAGHDPVAIDGAPEATQSNEEKLRAEYEALPAGADRLAFRAKHRDLFPAPAL